MSALTGESSGRGGGQAATWLPQLARTWETCEEFEIHWAIFDRGAKAEETTRCWNQFFHRLPTSSISASMLMARWPHRIAARHLLRKIQPDLIHCWGTENLNGSALCDFKGPSILSMQGIITRYFQTGDLKGWRWNLFRHWEPVSIRKATMVTSESQWGMDQVTEIVPGKNLDKVEYGVHPSYYDIQWNPSPAKPRILFVGSQNRLKGIDIIVEMLRQHPNRGWKMVFVGGGYLGNALRDLNDSSVEVLGLLKTDEVQAEMSKAWAVVMPSRADTSPNVVKESRVIGLPVIGSPNGGHAEYIDHGKDGLIVPTEDPEAWFAALNQLATNYELCKQMGSLNQERFREYFRPEKTAEGFLELYRKMLS